MEKKKSDLVVFSVGTRLSGLVSDEENQPPRLCEKCIFYRHDLCHNSVVMIDPEVLGAFGKPKGVGEKWCCNEFQSHKRTLIYALRHGEDEDDDVIGGWNDAPIDENGEKDAKEAAEYLRHRGIRTIFSSDMSRALETAKIVAKVLGIKPTDISTDFRLRTWNKGIYNGQEKTEENKAALKEYKENPHWVIPKGESHDQFEDRHDEAFDFYLDYARQHGVILLALHNSGIKQLQRYVRNEPITSEGPDSVLPGGVARVTEQREFFEDPAVLSIEVVLKDKPGSSNPDKDKS